MPVRYRDVPIVEAIFEFAPRDGALDDAAADHLDRIFGAVYAGRHDELRPLAVRFEYREGKATIGDPGPAPVRYRRWNADGSRLVQFSADLFAFNALKPYTHFVDYVPAIEESFSAYVETVSPNGTLFLGQRYINRIALPAGSAAADYFNIYPASEKIQQLRHPPFSTSIQTEEFPADLGGQVTIQLVSQGIEDKQPIYFLDIYARTPDHPEVAFNWASVRGWQTYAHDAIERAFELVLTDQAKLFLGREEYS